MIAVERVSTVQITLNDNQFQTILEALAVSARRIGDSEDVGYNLPRSRMFDELRSALILASNAND